jgi:hypothetical protein
MNKPFNPRCLLRPGFIFCFTLSVVFAKSQTEIDTSFRTQMAYVFANVDKSKVPYGLLRDYAMEFTNLEYFNGTTALADSNQVNADVFWQVYNTLVTARVHGVAAGFVSPDTLDIRWYSYRQPGRITLAGLFYNYSRFKDNAYPNYITITSNRLYDKYVSGVWQNPYQSEKVFIISPSITQYSALSFSILLPINIWFTNATNSGLSINTNDGLGYRILTPGTSLSVNYLTAGIKEWTYRLALTAGGYLYAHSFVEITTTGG